MINCFRLASMDLDTSLMEAKQAIHCFFNNDFEQAKKILEPWADSSMYHSLGKSVLVFLEAILTFEQVLIVHFSHYTPAILYLVDLDHAKFLSLTIYCVKYRNTSKRRRKYWSNAWMYAPKIENIPLLRKTLEKWSKESTMILIQTVIYYIYARKICKVCFFCLINII